MTKQADKATGMWVIRKLRAAGFQALFAGGCVRDMLMNARPSDYDIATDATPQQVGKIFTRVVMVGAKFGVAIVMRQSRCVEVATFRSDLSYSDGRRPDAVKFSTPRQDALRRDFTINGIFYDPIADEVIDYVNGQEDISARIIRTIGKPETRFAEDYLRMLRAVRFSIRLGFKITPPTTAAIRKYAKKISNISGERICDELGKILARKSAPDALELLENLGLAPEILPELFDGKDPALWTRAVTRVAQVKDAGDAMLNFAALLNDLSKTEISQIVRRWGASNQFKSTVTWCSEHRDDWQHAFDMPLCDLKRILASPNWLLLKRIWFAREQMQHGGRKLTNRAMQRIASIDPKLIAPERFVTGSDLMKVGLRESRAIGKILDKLYDEQLNENITSRRQALAAAKADIASSREPRR